MALELLSLFCTFENSSKRKRISLDSHSFLEFAERFIPCKYPVC